MLNLCHDITSDKEYCTRVAKTFDDIVKWYKKTHEKYSDLLRREMSSTIESFEKAFVSDLGDSEKNMFDLDFQFSTKLSFFSVADALEKIMLCCHSYSLDRNFCNKYNINTDVVSNNLGRKWLDINLNDVQTIEILSKVLADENKTSHFDLSSLHEDRAVRSKGTHSAYFDRCLSALRCYNTIREMIIFLSHDLDDELLRFVYPNNNCFDIDDFISKSRFSFDDYTTLLITESCHDVSEQHLATVANLNWDIVIDFDGFTKSFGLAKTISHSNVQYQLLTNPKTISPTDTIDHAFTRWYKCGDYQLRTTGHFATKSKSYASLITGNSVYCEKRSQLDGKDMDLFDRIIKLAYKSERAINIVILSNNSKILKYVCDSCINIDPDYSFFCTWIGFGNLPDDIYFDPYDTALNDELINEHIAHYNCTFDQFYEKISERKQSLGWQTRHSDVNEFLLPTEKMPEGKIISENDRMALERYFDALYFGAEYDSSRIKEDTEHFYCGGKASWSVIASNEALMLSDKTDSFIDKIKTSMGISQTNAEKQVFFIKHSSGQGGTTLARQIAWKLHKQYPVLELKRSPGGDFQQLLQSFYDRMVDSTPFVILCDDASAYLNELISLVSGIQRRFSLIISTRENNSLLKEYKNAYYLPFTTLKEEMITALKIKFRANSQLSEDILKQKDEKFDTALSDKKPFFIGLYYKEKDFDIENYVKKTFINAPDERYRKALACIAMCDILGQKNVPAIIIRKMLSITSRTGIFSQYPDSTSLILSSENGVPFYSFRHPLLAEKYFNLYAEHSGQSIPDIYFKLAKELIIYSGEACKGTISIPTVDLLSYAMIKKRDDADGATGNKVSKLLSNLGTEEQRISILQQLSDTFVCQAKDFILLNDYMSDESHKKIINLVAHSYAHIGRIYSKSPMNNYSKAAEYLGSARSYMIGNDPDIYHMEGTAYHEQLKYKLDYYRSNPQDENTKDILSLFEKSVGLYDQATLYNSPEYGISSKLTLCKDVLCYLCETKQLKSKNDIARLKTEEQEVFSCFLDALDEVERYGIEENSIAEERVYKCKEWLNSGLIFGNSSEVVAYFQQKYDNCDKTDFYTTNRSLLNLTYAKINHYRNKYDTAAFHRNIDKTKLMTMRTYIEMLLDAPYFKESITDYFRRTRLFSEWFQIAKALGQPVLDCISKANAWIAMEEEFSNNMTCKRNPLPWYYLMVFYYLEALEGGTTSVEEAKKCQREIRSESSSSSYGQTKFQDILIEGKGAGQLLNVRNCSDEETILAEAKKYNVTPKIVKGIFNSTAVGAGDIQLFSPMQLDKVSIHVHYGKNIQNTLNDHLKEHKVASPMGFIVLRPCALSNYVKDESAGEHLDMYDIISKINTRGDYSNKNRHKKNKPIKKRIKQRRH